MMAIALQIELEIELQMQMLLQLEMAVQIAFEIMMQLKSQLEYVLRRHGHSRERFGDVAVQSFGWQTPRYALQVLHSAGNSVGADAH